MGQKHALHQPVQRVEIGAVDPQEVIGLPGQGPCADDLGLTLRQRGEIAGVGLGMGGHDDLDEGLNAEAHRCGSSTARVARTMPAASSRCRRRAAWLAERFSRSPSACAVRVASCWISASKRRSVLKMRVFDPVSMMRDHRAFHMKREEERAQPAC
jgi:hypothetical protein